MGSIRRSAFLAFIVVFQTCPLVARSGDLNLPPYKKLVLKNGLTLLLLERHNLPLVSLHMVINAGAVLDPAGREGLASSTAALLHRGTKSRSADQFSDELDSIGGTLGADTSSDSTTISAEFVKKDLPQGLELFSDAVVHPAFPQDEVTKILKLRVDAAKAAKDLAARVILSYFNAYLYGTHPYARPTGGDEKSLASITRDDISEFYQANYTPGNTILAAVGDFATAQMEGMLNRAFDTWATKSLPAATLPGPAPAKGKRLLLIDKPDSTQTYFLIGNLGIERTNPDRVYIHVINTLFGGRFTSMLMSELRTRTGLAYSASSFFDPRKVAGPFVISTYTKNETTEAAMDLALDVLKKFHDRGISWEELSSAKNYIKGQFPPTIETSDQLARLLATLQFYGLDDSEINTFYTKIDAMTMADAKRVIERYFPLDNLVFVVIGKSSEIGEKVRKYASKIDALDISKPGFGSFSGRL